MNTKKSQRRVSSKSPAEARIATFRKAVWGYYKKHARNELPWRKTHDPYKILVSEVMLQQTQVPRVIEKYKEFLVAFPTIYLLAQASLSEVLKAWSGLGYNRRAKYLHDAARVIVAEYKGDVEAATAAKKLRGVGPYTKAAVRVFAFNEPHVLIETNIRAAFIHHFYSSVLQNTAIRDRELMPVIEKAAESQDPREWHFALMDYGSHIKKSHNNPARRSASHVRQSKFEGSLRQIRGAILRALHEGASLKALPYEQARLKTALESLQKDGLLAKQGKTWRIA